MSPFQPNQSCQVRKTQTKNVFGEEQLGDPIDSMCSVVKLDITIARTSVRADTSATRGAAREYIGEATLLFTPDSNVALDDQIDVLGYKLRVVTVFPRSDLQGNPHHLQVQAGIWGKAS
jgi:hypothetical protein